MLTDNGHTYFETVDEGICSSSDRYFKNVNTTGNEIEESCRTKSINEQESSQIRQLQLSDFKSHTHFVLNLFLQNAERNLKRHRGGFRYCNETQKFATYLRLTAGRLAYETLQKNIELALPSIVSVNRYTSKFNYDVSEGVLRCNELLQYLEQRNLPKYVIITEDATRITGRAQYDRLKNKIIGFALPLNEDGMPNTDTFHARNVEEIVNHFSSSNTIASFANVVMAHPITTEKVPAFPLLVFGSDNR